MNAPAPVTVTQWLLAQNWGELARHFSAHPPACADEYNARALMNLHQSNGAVDWPSVIADMREACALKPGDLLLAVNLTQALLDCKQTQEAYETAKRTSESHPDAYPAMEKLAASAVATQRWAEAHGVLLHAQERLGQKQPLPEQAARLLAELSSRWWEPVAKGRVVLRIPEPSDADFLSGTFRDEAFMLHYHRFQGASDEAVKDFILRAKLAPRQSRRIDWIILDNSGNRVGLAAIVDIDWGNERGELLVGLPGKRAQTIALKASVAILEFAFERLRLAKMTSYVYADNSEAQANTLHLGFEQEGLLRSHIASTTGRIDLFVNGMTRAGYAGNALLDKLARRWKQPTAIGLVHGDGL
jgi:RimJ/RimL family protein N-acetyltransferase